MRREGSDVERDRSCVQTTNNSSQRHSIRRTHKTDLLLLDKGRSSCGDPYKNMYRKAHMFNQQT